MPILDTGQIMTGSEMPDAKGPNTDLARHLVALPITDATIEETAEDFILRAGHVRYRRKAVLFDLLANGQVHALCHHDREFDAMLRQADQIHADGMSLVIFSRTFCPNALRERVATTDLVPRGRPPSGRDGCAVLFPRWLQSQPRRSGGNAEALSAPGFFRAAQRLFQPGRRKDSPMSSHRRPIFSGSASGFRWSNASFRAIWTGFPGIAVVKTCGGLFDFLAGKNSRAPQWMQDMGLEWLYTGRF